MPPIDPDLLEKINRAVAKAAAEVEPGLDYSEIPARRQYASRLLSSRIMLHLLSQGDIGNVRTQDHIVKEIKHRYVIINPEHGLGAIIVDPTWQQFLPEGIDKTDLPTTLIGTRQDVITKAAAAGVSEEAIKIWQQEQVHR